MESRRPTPEEMLARARAEETHATRGHLKVFLGAAPGVGKTFSMLEAARALRRDGLDVVAGWVETHGRKETEVLLDGLERLPARTVEYRGMTLEEFDLDAALQRHPALLLVDELAHSNAEGSRHSKRWQDVDELLQAGVDVYTTLNIQHLESMNDLVAIVTGVAVLETVPDSVIDSANEVELVDLPPDELLQRLRDGKVYVPHQIEAAMANFFRKGNLIALRELALRRVAERVDAQVAEWRRGSGVARPWPTRDRLLVAVGPAPQSAHLIRAAFRMATRLRAPWIALSVETPAFDRLSPEDRARVGEHLELAEQLGAETLVVRGERTVDEILAVVHERSVSRVVVGKPARPRWIERLRGSLVDDLVRRSGEVELLVTTGEEARPAGPRQPLPRKPVAWPQYAWGFGAVAAATVVGLTTRRLFSLADQSMIYLLAIVIVSSRVARVPSLLAAILSVAALDFFFVPPFFTFDVDDFRHAVTFGVMLGVGVTVSHLTLRIREQAAAASQRERRTAALYAMSRDFAVETEVEEIAATAVRAVQDLLGVDAAVFVSGPDGQLVARGAHPDWLVKSEREMAVARWVYDHGLPAGHSTDTLPSSECMYLPLVGASSTRGVLAAALGRRREPPTPAQHQLLETFVAQTALAVERAVLAETAAQASLSAETERTRNTLLSAVSHDLRTPLAAIAGTAELVTDPKLPDDVRREMLATIRSESQRLARLLTNLLDLSRLESGAHVLHREICPVEETLVAALAQLKSRLARHDVRVHSPAEDLLVAADPVLLEQAVVNLLDNAAKYSPAGSIIDVRASGTAQEVTIEVADHGPGIPAGEEERIFERFYRAGDGARAEGAGLGLAICRGIARALGGRVEAHNRPDGGAVFSFVLPREQGAPVLKDTGDAVDAS